MLSSISHGLFSTHVKQNALEQSSADPRANMWAVRTLDLRWEKTVNRNIECVNMHPVFRRQNVSSPRDVYSKSL